MKSEVRESIEKRKKERKPIPGIRCPGSSTLAHHKQAEQAYNK